MPDNDFTPALVEFHEKRNMSKKTKIAKLMTPDAILAMADDFVAIQDAAEDDNSRWRLKTKQDWSQFLHNWAKGLGSME